SAVASGLFRDRHFSQLSKSCVLMTCERAGSADTSWTMQRIDAARTARYGTVMTLPVTLIAYGYTAKEDLTEHRTVSLLLLNFIFLFNLICDLFFKVPIIDCSRRNHANLLRISTVFSFLLISTLINSWLTSVLSATDVV
ncbi:hypothetical protein PFISCL1PPCAC_23506, partial [Pristionchus fissidentatus]